jgi:hypothetical protein
MLPAPAMETMKESAVRVAQAVASVKIVMRALAQALAQPLARAEARAHMPREPKNRKTTVGESSS